MSNLKSTCVTLRISGDDLEPSEITQLLGVQPTLAGAKGSPRISKKTGQVIFNPQTGEPLLFRTGQWHLSSNDRQPGDLSSQFKEMFDCLPEDPEIWLFLQRRFELNFFCGLFMGQFNDGDTLDHKVLLEAGRRGISIGLDIYAPIADEDSHS